MNALESLIANYVNGNLTDAKKQAKRITYARIYRHLREEGRGPDAAEAIASYLKGQGSFQAACDAEHAAKEARR